MPLLPVWEAEVPAEMTIDQWSDFAVEVAGKCEDLGGSLITMHFARAVMVRVLKRSEEPIE